MSTQRDSLTPVPARQAALCMCANGAACTSFAPGHALHLIQARLVAATPREWQDAIVQACDERDGVVVLRTLDDGALLTVWNAEGAAATVRAGDPVSLHARYHVLAVGRQTRFNVAVAA
ncbi:hypothetical protein [Microbacterium sp.]|uniref:hypothetical protein n=1 Tax=Microbacterium sp. TaxID=51671 RepID=UPI0039E2A278